MTNSKEKLIRSCSIWRALEVIGDKPTILLLESYWLGARKFSEFSRHTGLLKTVVSDRLQKLVEEGCLRKAQYSSKPVRYEYHGTEKLFGIYPIAMTMLHWERKWSGAQNKVDIELRHTDCGQLTTPAPVCGACRAPIDPRDVQWQEGPGVGEMNALYSRRRRSKSTAQEQSQTRLFDTLAGIIGDRWSMLIIRALFTGNSAFNEIQEDSQIATNILTERLTFLLEQKILSKTSARGELRQRYKLTARGLDIYPVILAMMGWGDRWFADENGPPVLLFHKPCNQDLNMAIACSACEKDVSYENIEFQLRDTDQSQSTSLSRSANDSR